jgi:hypothetical protein
MLLPRAGTGPVKATGMRGLRNTLGVGMAGRWLEEYACRWLEKHACRDGK